MKSPKKKPGELVELPVDAFFLRGLIEMLTWNIQATADAHLPVNLRHTRLLAALQAELALPHDWEPLAKAFNRAKAAADSAIAQPAVRVR
jgi:hypothetical protein